VAHTWAPEWFDDGGVVKVIANIDTLNTDSDFKPYIFTALDSALTSWSGPVPLGIGPNYIDTFVLESAGTYHVFAKNETTRYCEHATASALTGPWHFVGTGDWAGWGSRNGGTQRRAARRRHVADLSRWSRLGWVSHRNEQRSRQVVSDHALARPDGHRSTRHRDSGRSCQQRAEHGRRRRRRRRSHGRKWRAERRRAGARRRRGNQRQCQHGRHARSDERQRWQSGRSRRSR
jgi:hypothetical protein